MLIITITCSSPSSIFFFADTFRFVFFFAGLIVFRQSFLAAVQQTILLRVNNCNNLGLIDASCSSKLKCRTRTRTLFDPRGLPSQCNMLIHGLVLNEVGDPMFPEKICC